MRVKIIFRLSFLNRLNRGRTANEPLFPAPLLAFPALSDEPKAIDLEEPGESTSDPWVVDYPEATWECPRALLESMATEAMEGFTKLPSGGPELGGVLYGTKTGNRVRILANRAIPCEHAHGPAFTLSEHDQEGLENLLGETSERNVGLVPVGWYHTAYQELRPAAGSAALHNRWFPEPWQLVMVLRRERRRPVRVGMFQRDANGALATDTKHQTAVDTPENIGTVPGRPSIGVPLPASQAAQSNGGLAVLLDGIRERSGLMLLACPAGGEMRLMADLRCALQEKSLALAWLEDVPATREQFYRQLSEALHLRQFGSSMEARAAALLGFLWAQARTGSATLLVLNQADKLSGDVVEELRALNDLRGTDGRLLQTILCCTRTEGVEKLQEQLTDARASERAIELPKRRAAMM
jgi:hypothetical protein